jgi:predicted lipoprotein with Yx(FWY)xxD motif
MRIRGWAVAGLGLLVPVLAACGPSSTTPGSAYGSGSANPTTSASSGSASGMGTSGTSSTGMTKTVTLTIKTTKIGKVLADAKGDTLYWYAKDMKSGPSTCTGGCLSAWPVVAGKPVAAMGVAFAGKLGSVTDAGGTVQATYNGYPLYTYAEDMTPGETSGNGAAGAWHVISGQYLVSSMSGSGSSGSGSSGSGYGSGYGSGSKLSGSTGSGASTGSGSAGMGSTSSGSSGSKGSSGSGGSTGSTGSSGSKSSNPAPSPVPTSSINGGGCGSGSCW